MNKKTWLTLVLVVSIGMNLIFVGVIIGRYVLGKPPGRPQLDWMMQEISDETRDKFRASMREHKQASKPARRELRHAQTSLHDAITAEDYIEADVIAGFSGLRQASTTLQKSMHHQIVQNLRQLAPEERAQVIKMMTHRGRKHRQPTPHPPFHRMPDDMPDSTGQN